jgi:hypothetical protein
VVAVVADIDLGYKAIVRELKKLDGHEVNAGILKNAGKGKRGVPVVAYAIYNEFGTRHIPSRPFVRIASDENRKAWGNIAADGVGKIIDRQIKWRKCCDMVGKRMKEDIKKVIGDKSKLAPNAESTIRRKGHDKPLIDTGLMKSKVNFRVD